MNQIEREKLTKSIIESKEKIDKFMSEFETLPEYEVIDRISTLQRTHYILEENYKELVQTIDKGLDVSSNSSLTHPKNNDLVQQALLEITRRLHNYEASVMAMVDHTRGLYSHLYKENNLFEEYISRKNQTFLNNPLVSFVQDLRDYFIHKHIPRLTFGFLPNIDTKETKPLLTFTLEEMKKYQKWSATAKEFLKNSGNYIDVINLISAYHKIVTGFYEWFFSRVEVIHLKEREKLWELQQEQMIITINLNIDLCIGFTQAFETRLPMPYHNEEIFENLLDREELKELAKFKPGSKVRSEKAIEFVETKIALPVELKEKIRYIYSIPEFCRTSHNSNRPVRNQQNKRRK